MDNLQPKTSEYFTIERLGHDIKLTRKWRLWQWAVIPLFAILLILLLEEKPLDLWPVLLVMAYLLAICALNETCITIGPTELRISYGPIPFRMSRKFEMRNVERVETRAEGRSHQYASTGIKGPKLYVYKIAIRLIDGASKHLHTFRFEKDAKFFKQTINQFLAQ
jgi:hypothetical protein